MTIATDLPKKSAGGPAGERRAGDYSGGERPKRISEERNAERRARGLGWFSIGLGLAQIGAPRTMARLIGINDDDETRTAMLAIGLREITSGIGILSRPRSTGWVWSRVGGDLMDLALLGKALNSDENNRSRVAAAAAAVLGVTALDVVTGRRLSKSSGSGEEHERRGAGKRTRSAGGIEVTQVITINRPRPEVYGLWRNFENFPRFMAHLESVQVLNDRRSRWKARAPAGTTVEWEAEIVDDRPDELIAWRALPESPVPNSGLVRFRDAPGDRGTEVIVELRYQPPGGRLGALVAKLFGEEPSQQVKGDLRRLKQVLEIGEIVHSEASIHRGPHPAQPPEDLSEVDIKSPELAGLGRETGQ